MQFGPPRPSGRLIALTPLIDVVFILLVFFMLAASYLDWRAVDLSVASGSATATPDGRTLLIGLAADGTVSVDAVPVAAPALRATLAAALADSADRGPDRAPDRAIVIRAAPGVPLQRAIDMLDLARALGATRVALARER